MYININKYNCNDHLWRPCLMGLILFALIMIIIIDIFLKLRYMQIIEKIIHLNDILYLHQYLFIVTWDLRMLTIQRIYLSIQFHFNRITWILKIVARHVNCLAIFKSVAVYLIIYSNIIIVITYKTIILFRACLHFF